MTEKSSAASDGGRVNAGAQDLAINNTRFNRIFTRVALKTLAKLHKSDGYCSPISRKLIIKTGPWVDLTEAATMRFIAENTSIPVPKVYCSFVHRDRTYILMERIQGEELPRAWARLEDQGRTKIFAQLKQMIGQMRALEPPPDTGVQSCCGGSLYDSRMNRPEGRFGPFATIQEFHLWLRKGFRLAEHPHPEKLDDQERQNLAKMEEMQDGPWPRPVFTHADLNPCNILVRGEEVVGIIDWEFAGWYPRYWEYTSAWFGNLIRTEWQNTLSGFLEQHPAEFAMERTRNRWWGEF
ncbi:kinase subdomain-containing protein, partial [Aureobasidium melanogenum]|uniref:Kinase subdomain-containing protein n=1 Tax=Aureobasidium melanogenum (strain CBS 110374) TaxID=1043003 RepID=A0A074W3G0_AURM1